MMQGFNPLDWAAGPFLTLYVAVALAGLAAVYLRRDHLGRSVEGSGAGLGVLHLAYLAGGAERAGDAALVALLEAGAAVPDAAFKAMRFDPEVAVAPEFQPFRHASPGGVTREEFRRVFAVRWDRLRSDLLARGLVPTEDEVRRFRMGAAAILGVPLLLGVCKAGVGVGRDRPVGILIGLVLATAVLGVAAVWEHPTCNRAGHAVLEAARRAHARAARAPLPDEVALAFALTGSAVLAGRKYRRMVVGKGGNGGDGGCGGDGGGGCGGCSD